MKKKLQEGKPRSQVLGITRQKNLSFDPIVALSEESSDALYLSFFLFQVDFSYFDNFDDKKSLYRFVKQSSSLIFFVFEIQTFKTKVRNTKRDVIVQSESDFFKEDPEKDASRRSLGQSRRSEVKADDPLR